MYEKHVTSQLMQLTLTYIHKLKMPRDQCPSAWQAHVAATYRTHTPTKFIYAAQKPLICDTGVHKTNECVSKCHVLICLCACVTRRCVLEVDDVTRMAHVLAFSV